MKKHPFFIQKYLENRPSFYAYIRPQEAILFYDRITKMKGPILDFGCGDGFFASTIFRKKYIDVGLDVASSRMKESTKTGVYKQLEEYDGMTIPFKSRVFGSIISNCVFEHIPHIEKSIQEMNRVTKKNGLLMTTVMCSSWSDNLLGKKIFGKKYTDWFNGIQHHDSLFSKSKWTKLFTSNGYRVVESVDYLFEKASQKTEMYHFFSFFSLITYLMLRRWSIFPSVSEKKIEEIERIVREDKNNPSACFFVLQKA